MSCEVSVFLSVNLFDDESLFDSLTDPRVTWSFSVLFSLWHASDFPDWLDIRSPPLILGGGLGVFFGFDLDARAFLGRFLLVFRFYRAGSVRGVVSFSVRRLFPQGMCPVPAVLGLARYGIGISFAVTARPSMGGCYTANNNSSWGRFSFQSFLVVAVPSASFLVAGSFCSLCFHSGAGFFFSLEVPLLFLDPAQSGRS